MIHSFFNWFNKRIRSLSSPARTQTIGLYSLLTYPVLYEGLSQEVLTASTYELQRELLTRGLLNELSGEFDEATKEAVENFQRQCHLRVDGVVGSLTWAALKCPQLVREETVVSENTEAVKKLQELLRRADIDIEVDGVFSSDTEKALKRFQRCHGLLPDGICGPMTWSALLGQRLVWEPVWHSQKVYLLFSRFFEQIVMVVAVYIGIRFSPWAQNFHIDSSNILVTAYALVCIAKPFLERILGEPFNVAEFSILRFSPYVMLGFLSRHALVWVSSMAPLS